MRDLCVVSLIMILSQYSYAASYKDLIENESKKGVSEATNNANTDSNFKKIRSDIESNWHKPINVLSEMPTIIRIYLNNSGEITSIVVEKSSGLYDWDNSAILAVAKTGRFPYLKELDRSQFDRYFNSFSVNFQ